MPASLAQPAVQALLTRFRRQRPLRAGSLLITIFGDALAPRGGEISLGSLIGLAQPFGLTDRLVRTSVARLAADGWLEAERHGRQSDYRLTEHGRARFAEATQRIYGEGPASWDKHWTLVILPQASGKARDRAREELKWLGFGQLAAGVFAHPTRKLSEVRQELRELKLLDEVIVMEGSAQGAQNSQLVLAAWDLAELGRGYKRFIAMFDPLAGTSILEPKTAFIVRTLLIHEYRKVHLRDPLLPQSLLPADWVGTRAYRLCHALYAQVFDAAEAFLSLTVSTRKGSLPSAPGDARRRFGAARVSIAG